MHFILLYYIATYCIAGKFGERMDSAIYKVANTISKFSLANQSTFLVINTG